MTSQGSSPGRGNPEFELLAPAGDAESLAAALDAGADAIYLGLTFLNARRRARNFSAAELVDAVALAHRRSARVYLTLNVDLAERELSQAARALEAARKAGVDAVLVRDPALLALAPHFPGLELHFSTQAACANSADLEAARLLGIRRAVLARELTLAEISACSRVRGVETEVFVHGALCFSVSGRCLLASWVGGHSGNRGACTSPCRVPWSADGADAGTPLSMRDLGTAHRLGDLKTAGVRALKIEGRLKTAAWVRRAVSLYRRALDGEAGQGLLDEAQALGAMSGRQLTCGYFDGERAQLTGVASRERSLGPAEPAPPSRGYRLAVEVGPRALRVQFDHLGAAETWSLPKSEVRRAHKAVAIGALFERLSANPVDRVAPASLETNEAGFLLVPRAANALEERVAALVRRGRKGRSAIDQELAPALREALRPGAAHPSNTRALGQRWDRARISAEQAASFLEQVQPQSGLIVEGASAEQLERLDADRGRCSLIAALPSVFFEEDLPAIRELVARAKRLGLRVEVNSWGGWFLAREAGARFEAGPGLGVLNSLAARALADRGAEAVTASVEADRSQLEDLSEHCEAPLSVVVFGRPALMLSRVALEGLAGRVLLDRRAVRLVARREAGLTALRPLDPFDLRGSVNARVHARHLCLDLVASPDPVGEWSQAGISPLAFNYGRSLA